MKFRITEYCGVYYPEYKDFLFWRKIPTRLHSWEPRYVYYASSYEQALDAIEVFKEKGDISKARIIEVK